MGKIICDICGTSYQENAKQCPVCGCVRPGDVQRVTNEVKADEKGASGYTYVKGGRFSKSNVKKRNKANKAETKAKTNDSKVKANATKAKARPAVAVVEEEEPRTNRGLAIVAIVLLLAIIGVVIYIAMGFFDNIAGTNQNTGDPAANGSAQANVACTGIVLLADNVVIDAPGNVYHLEYTLQPEGTTEKPTFTSKDPKIATVDEKGNITAVAEGITEIVVVCGKIEAKCTVNCSFPKETLPTIAPTTPGGNNSSDATAPTDAITSKGAVAVNRSEITLVKANDSWNLYSGAAAKNKVEFRSDDEKIAKFVDGEVIAVGKGVTYVYASYNGDEVACKVRCSFNGIAGDEAIPVNRTGEICNIQSNMNVRSGPGTEYDRVDSLNLGDQVTVSEIQYAADGSQWGHVEKGWVSMYYVKLDAE